MQFWQQYLCQMVSETDCGTNATFVNWQLLRKFNGYLTQILVRVSRILLMTAYIF